MPQSIVQPLRRWDPERIGSYTIIGRLGAGAMGQVFLARSTAGRLVAVKTIRVELAEEPGFRARFAREVAAASRVSGVFTAAVIEADPDADLPWVATAYVPAPSLSTLVKKAGPLPVPAVRWLAAGCAEALQSIHGAGLLHRDVKPSNVLVAPDGPRVIDFGVARAAERVQLTSTRGAAGTPAYMAPEQARDATLASPASDVFSLGATLVYAATGHPPYRGETVMDILVRLATEPPDLDGLPDELSALVTACLQRVPRDRPTDSAILGRLGSFALSNGAGHVYLPDSAMSVIAEYLVVAEFQHHPSLAGDNAADAADLDYAPGDRDSADGATDDSGAPVITDVTDRSQTPLPGFESPAVFSQADQPKAGFRAEQGSPRQPEPLTGPVLPAVVVSEVRPVREPQSLVAFAWLTQRALLPFWARILFVVVFIALGIAIGQAIHLADPPAAAANPQAAGGTVGNTGLGTGSNPPALCSTTQSAATPALCVSQPEGDGYTLFVLHGTGFPRFTSVTVSLLGVGTSPDHPVTDIQGTFNYAIDQGHVFFRTGKIPPGTYQVVVTAPGEPSLKATFVVNRAASGGPPGPPPG
ncbi:MAG TPA: serine/threonine-protein kinase [Trebonia sp.]|nr:serine/threonine-protein kinase [Trebonia sp.]